MNTIRLPQIAVSRKLWLVGGALLLAWLLVIVTAADAQAASCGGVCSAATMPQHEFQVNLATNEVGDLPAQVIVGRISNSYLKLNEVNLFYYPVPTPLSPFGILEIRATLENIIPYNIRPRFFAVGGLNGNLVLNASPALSVVPIVPVGSSLNQGPTVSQGEEFTIVLYIGLWHLSSFPLEVVVFGQTDIPEPPFLLTAEEDEPFIIEVDVETAQRGARLYLPHINQ